MSDCHQHVIDKRFSSRQSSVAYRKQLHAVDSEMDITASTIEPRPVTLSDQYVRSICDRCDVHLNDQRADTIKISPVHSTTEEQLKV